MKHKMDRRTFGRGISCAVFAPVMSSAWGQSVFPSKPVTLIVPNAPGGAIDILARVLQQQLQPIWNQPIIVEYKAGAGTVLGTDFVAKAAPNGYTLCLVATPHVINPAMRQMPFDTVKDLSGITILGVSNVLISATSTFPANNLREAIALIRKNPGKFSYASPGSGSSMHLAMELLKQNAGLDILHVPFKGSGPAYAEVMAGRIELLVDPMFSTLPFVKSGKLKPLAATASKRSAIAPDIESVAETVPGFNVQSMFGLVLSSGTPRDVVAKIYADVVSALTKPETQKKMTELGLEPVSITPEQFDARIKTDIDRWTQLVRSANIKTE
jgi:tripartite-type tricarboxylate transporter receptor subunit TctC